MNRQEKKALYRKLSRMGYIYASAGELAQQVKEMHEKAKLNAPQ